MKFQSFAAVVLINAATMAQALNLQCAFQAESGYNIVKTAAATTADCKLVGGKTFTYTSSGTGGVTCCITTAAKKATFYANCGSGLPQPC